MHPARAHRLRVIDADGSFLGCRVLGDVVDDLRVGLLRVGVGGGFADQPDCFGDAAVPGWSVTGQQPGGFDVLDPVE